MAQKQFTTYKQDITSFELRSALLGIVRPGRYSGYNSMSADGTPSGGNIPLKISHGVNGVKILEIGASSLTGGYGGGLGVAVTTQGTIIREDQGISLTIPDNSGEIDVRYYAIYLEHDFVEVQGANPATYGFITGNVGDVPDDVIILEEYHRVILGWIRADAGATSISDLTYFPSPSLDDVGEDMVLQKLFGVITSKYILNTESTGNVGPIPSDGIIGNRKYSYDNYVNSGESITDSIGNLDESVKTNSDSIISLVSRKLDDLSTPDDNTDLNATTSYHGLLPKLPSTDATKRYLRGDGYWTYPEARVMQRRLVTQGTADISLADLTATTVGAWVEVPLSGVVNSETRYVELQLWWSLHPTNTSSGSWYSIEFQSSDNTSSIIQITKEGGSAGTFVTPHQFSCFIDLTLKLRMRLNTSYGAVFTNWNQVTALYLGVTGYDKSSY